MLTVVVGARGSGKSTVAPHLRSVFDGAVIDWDAFMPAVRRVAGRDVREDPDLWLPYRGLVRSVVEELAPCPTVLLSICTPDELDGWPPARWLLLDCADDERRRRLTARGDDDVDDALADAADYRRFGLPVVDTTVAAPADVARRIAEFARESGSTPAPR